MQSLHLQWASWTLALWLDTLSFFNKTTKTFCKFKSFGSHTAPRPSKSRGSAHRKPLSGSNSAGSLIISTGYGPVFQASRRFVNTSKIHPKLVRFKVLHLNCSIFADNIALMDACEAMACSAFLCLTLNVKTVFHASPAPKTHYPC